jgi:hypothetical protein
MPIARSGHVAVQLPDGRVLEIGGTTMAPRRAPERRVPVTSPDVHDVASNVWRRPGPAQRGAVAPHGHRLHGPPSFRYGPLQ